MEAKSYSFGLLPDNFWDLTFHEYFLMQRGVYEYENSKEKREWERIRWLACVLMQPHKKKGTTLNPIDLMRFEWEKPKQKVDLEERRKAAMYAVKKFNIELPSELKKED